MYYLFIYLFIYLFVYLFISNKILFCSRARLEQCNINIHGKQTYKANINIDHILQLFIIKLFYAYVSFILPLCNVYTTLITLQPPLFHNKLNRYS